MSTSKLSRWCRRGGLLAAVAGASLAAAGSAHAACPTPPTVNAFSAFGDTADYWLLPGGNFENGPAGWSLQGGASVVSGNEAYFVGSSQDSYSVRIPASGTVVSPAFCVDQDHPHFRLFARAASTSRAGMRVKLRWTDGNGVVNEALAGVLSGRSFPMWMPTPELPLASVLPLSSAGETLDVQIVLANAEAGEAWQVDDVYVDPYRRA